MKLATAQPFTQGDRARWLGELMTFVRFPSVSAQPRYAADMQRCAHWLARHLRAIGMPRVGVEQTPRHPAVWAEWRAAPGRPTVLIYGHYDVQPPGPLEAWRSPPFAPTLRNGALYGRGASDDKGQLFAHIKALEIYLRRGGPPVNVVCLFEGEEEIGSPHMPDLLRRHRRRFAADVAVISDTRFLAPNRPAIIYGLRGNLSLELELRGQPRAVHSGSYGGALHNPLQALCELIARLHTRQGRIAIPGFYDAVRPISAAERARLARVGPSDAQILRDAGASQGWGEQGYSLYERTTTRPALTINGLHGGYAGPGGKGIIPAQASAKLSFRLVPDQEPCAIERLVRRHLATLTPATMASTIHTHTSTPPALLDPRLPAIDAAVNAYRYGYGVSPVLLRSGGSIPIVAMLSELLHVPTVLMGFGLPNDTMHGPNEKFELHQFFGAVRTCVAFLAEIATQRRP